MDKIGSAIYNGLAMFLSSSLFSDVQLRLKTFGEAPLYISSHKVILAAHSPFFQVLFHSGMTDNGIDEFDLHIQYPEAFLDIYRFMYYGDINIDLENVYEVIYVSDLLLMREMVLHCCKFLNDSMAIHNCIEILITAESHSCSDLLQSAQNFISQNLIAISSTPSFVRLSADEAYQLLDSEDLSCVDEEEVLRAVLNWITFEVTERRKHAFQVLSAVRFQFISIQTFNNSLKTLPPIPDKAFQVVITTLVNDLRTGKLFKNKRFIKKTRGKKYIVLFGGANAESLSYNMGTGTNYAYRYNTNDRSWRRLSSFNISRYKHTAALVGNRIYLIGGNNEFFSITSSVECYNLTTEEWTEVGDLLEYRKSPRSVMIGGQVCVISGEKGDEKYVAEAYVPTENKWIPINPLWRPSCMYNDSEALLLHNGMLYEFVNVDSRGSVRITALENKISTAEDYTGDTPLFGQPELPYPDLPYPRYKCAMVIVGESLYLMGGCRLVDETDSRDNIGISVDRLHLTQNKWDRIENMTYRRVGHVAQVIGGLIYVLGGQQARGPCYSEIYHPDTDSWELQHQPTNFLYSAALSY